MRTIYISPNGERHYKKPTSVNYDGRTYSPATDERLKMAGWTFEEEEEFQQPPYVPTYEERVVELIRERFTVDDEIAILRQRDTKPNEYSEYFEFCEDCKRIAREGI